MKRIPEFLRGLKHVWKLSSMDIGMKNYYKFKVSVMHDLNRLNAKVNELNNKIKETK